VWTTEHKEVSKYYARNEADGWPKEEAARDTSLQKAAAASFNIVKRRKNVRVSRHWFTHMNILTSW
jgi:hypothetical protein